MEPEYSSLLAEINGPLVKTDPKHQLSKIKSKYLIFEILGFSGFRNEVLSQVLPSSKKLRTLLVTEYKLFISFTLPMEDLKLIIDPRGFVNNGLTPIALSRFRKSFTIQNEIELNAMVELKKAHL